jgi:hypothetical protein
MQAVIERIMWTWNLIAHRTVEASEDAQTRVTNYLQPLFDGGEADDERLAVFGLTYLLEPVRLAVRR